MAYAASGNDTDVVVLATSFFHIVKTAKLQKLWILFGAGKGQKYICINAMFDSMGEHKAVALTPCNHWNRCNIINCNNRETDCHGAKCGNHFLKLLKPSKLSLYHNSLFLTILSKFCFALLFCFTTKAQKSSRSIMLER